MHSTRTGASCPLPLEPALRTLARRSPVKLDVCCDRRLDEAIEIAVFYVVSEAVANTAKHSRASTVHLDFKTADTMLLLSIEDDGIGGIALAAVPLAP